jgi:hypothetical protein
MRVLQNNERGFPFIFTITVVEYIIHVSLNYIIYGLSISKAIISLGFVFTIYSIKVLNSKWTVFQFDDKKFNKPNSIKLNSVFC